MKKYEQIYLVDDFEMVNILHGILLKKLGYKEEVRAYTNPEKALEELCSIKGKSDSILILLDINMPEMSGFEFLEFMVQADFSMDIDVVIVTSSISEGDKVLAEQYPRFVRDFVTKPLKLERLEKLIDSDKLIKNIGNL